MAGMQCSKYLAGMDEATAQARVDVRADFFPHSVDAQLQVATPPPLCVVPAVIGPHLPARPPLVLRCGVCILPSYLHVWDTFETVPAAMASGCQLGRAHGNGIFGEIGVGAAAVGGCIDECPSDASDSNGRWQTRRAR